MIKQSTQISQLSMRTLSALINGNVPKDSPLEMLDNRQIVSLLRRELIVVTSKRISVTKAGYDFHEAFLSDDPVYRSKQAPMSKTLNEYLSGAIKKANLKVVKKGAA